MDISCLTSFYENYDEDNRLKSKSGMVEFLTTIRYIEKYLKNGMSICEVGAGTGRYSHYFADKGYKVDAVELIERNIQIFKEKTHKEQRLTVTQGNALDLSHINNDIYDITLLLGPMYHLYSENDKKKAMNEDLRITKKSGLVFIAYCISDSAVIQHGFIGNNINKPIEDKLINTNDFSTNSKPIDIFELVRKEDIDKLNSEFNVKRLHYVSTDIFTHYIRDTIENMDEDTFKIYLDYHFSICEREDMCGITNHALDVLMKI